MNLQTTQEAFQIIQRMAELCATPGIDETSQKKANEVIQTLIDKVVKPSLDTLTAKAHNLVLK
jgi:hypothetical protein